MGALAEKTRGIDVLNLFKEKFRKTNLGLRNLISVCTDGVHSMKDLWHYFKELPNPCILMFIYFISHQQNLCAKPTLLSDTLKGVINIVNYNRANSIRPRQFRQLVHFDDETFNVDLPYHLKIRWLSRRQVLEKFLSLKTEIVKFLEDQNAPCKLSEQIFYKKAAFLSKLMSK